MTLGELTQAVYDKHVKGREAFPRQWIVWVLWARRTTGWMQPIVSPKKELMPDPIAALAYAIWDAESTSRLPPEHYKEYAIRARSLLHVMRLRPDDERKAIAKAIEQADLK